MCDYETCTRGRLVVRLASLNVPLKLLMFSVWVMMITSPKDGSDRRHGVEYPKRSFQAELNIAAYLDVGRMISQWQPCTISGVLGAK